MSALRELLEDLRTVFVSHRRYWVLPLVLVVLFVLVLVLVNRGAIALPLRYTTL